MLLSAAFKAANPNHPHVKNPKRPRRPRPISSGPKTGSRPPRRKLTTSELAIRRYEALRRKRKGTGRSPSKPLPGTGRRPRQLMGNDTTGGPRRTRGVNTGSRGRPVGRGRRPTRTTSQAAIARSRARIARRR